MAQVHELLARGSYELGASKKILELEEAQGAFQVRAIGQVQVCATFGRLYGEDLVGGDEAPFDAPTRLVAYQPAAQGP